MAAVGDVKKARLEEINDNIRNQLFRKGTKGLSGVARVFRQADFNGNKKLDLEEFEEALSFCGIFLKKGEVNFLFNVYDRDDDGNVNYEELLHGIQLPLSAPRLKMVNKAFAILDKDNSNVIDVDDLKGVYNASQHPDVLEGRKTPAEVGKTFLMGFERGQKDGRITKEEFVGYYEDLGASIPSDEYFVQMMENCWKIKREGAAAEATNVSKLLNMLKAKVAVKTKSGKSKALMLQKTFKFFDSDEGGHIGPKEFQLTMTNYGIPLTKKELSDFFDFFAGDDGKITIKEFVDAMELDD